MRRVSRKFLGAIRVMATVAVAMGIYKVGHVRGVRAANYWSASMSMWGDLELASRLRRSDTFALALADETLRRHVVAHCKGPPVLAEFTSSEVRITLFRENRASIRAYWKDAQAEAHWNTPYGNDVPVDEVELLSRCLEPKGDEKE